MGVAVRIELRRESVDEVDGPGMQWHHGDGSRGGGCSVRRHRLGVAAAALIALAVGTGTFAALLQADRARAEAARAEQVSTFLASLFDAANPFGAWKEEKSVTDLLAYADTKAQQELKNDPSVHAEVQSLLGAAFLAAYRSGIVSDTDATASLWQRDALYEPAMSAELRDRLLDGWRDAVSKLRTQD